MMSIATNHHRTDDRAALTAGVMEPLPRWDGPAGRCGPPFAAVLFDRDGTLTEDRPPNGHSELVSPMPGARAAVDRLRAAGIKLGVVTNQPAVSTGLISAEQLMAVNDQVDRLLGPFDTWQVCPHPRQFACSCRKPAPGLIHSAARALAVPVHRCVVVGDVGGDMRAAAAAGAFGVLVPTGITRLAEVAAAEVVARDLGAAVDWILDSGPCAPPAPPGRRVLVARTDSAGDVLLCGPAIRAVAATAGSVTLLCGPRGREAAALLPGVAEVIEWPMPWIDAGAPPVDAHQVEQLMAEVAARAFDEAIVFTSFHQSPLPLALLLRAAGVQRICAIGDHDAELSMALRVEEGLPEAERAMSLAQAAGYRRTPGDDGRLRVLGPSGQRRATRVVLHVGAAAPARSAPPSLLREVVDSLSQAGYETLVTGGPAERGLAETVAGRSGQDLSGTTDLAGLAALMTTAAVVIAANTGPAHLAAATGTPVVSLYAPTVPFRQWRPYGVPYVRLGPAIASCSGTRLTDCRLPGHPCLGSVTPHEVVAAVRTLAGSPA
jgi:histidinol-phosphate phosphatase family protein